jgi:RNA recognition motif-containing protein
MNFQSLSEEQRSLFLGDLSCFCNEQDVQALFQSVGRIEKIRIMRGRNNKPLGYGFITFFELSATQAAMKLNGMLLVGRPLK